ncbi:MAG: carboxypeptidase-like regulatory domain-containing protein [Alphaproteobacteria bacterium]
MRKRWIVILPLFFLLLFGCTRGDWDGEETDFDEDYGYLENDEEGNGPFVCFEPEAEPIQKIPFPNDVSTSIDPTTPTGLRINLPVEGATSLERDFRKNLNKLDGFCTFCTIRVTFDRPVDLTTITENTVYGVNVQEGSPFYGEIVEFDLGRGYFPVELKSPDAFYPNDPNADSNNQLFADDNRERHYEDETNTLLLRPMVPLHQQSRYVIILTKGMKGENGEIVQPPRDFAWRTFPNQLADVDAAARVLHEQKNFNIGDVAFAWRFTTMSVTQPLERIRAGLWGEGLFDYLAEEIPPQINEIHHFSTELDNDNSEWIMNAATLDNLLDTVDALIGGAGGVPLSMFATFEYVDYLVSGTYLTPLFLDTDDRVWNVDWLTGEAEYGFEEVPFYIAVPKPCEANGFAQPPYPIAFFLHANIRNRLDIIAICNALAARGIASFSIDAAEHGPETYLTAVKELLEGVTSPPPEGILSIGVEAICKLIIKLFYPSVDTSQMSVEELVDYVFTETWLGAAMHGRTYDYNEDGFLESGMSFFSANIMRSRDITRQTQVDLFNATRIVKLFGTDFDGNGHLGLYEGDFNEDGVLDVGGPDNPIYFVGMSLGSLMGSGFVALEPYVETAVLNVPGGGLTDILQRTRIPNVVQPIRAELTGPAVVGRPDPVPGRVALTINRELVTSKFATIGLQPGARVVLTNRSNGETEWTTMDAEGNFSLAVPADFYDLLELEVVSEDGDVLERLEWVSRYRGLGVSRNTPRAREFIDNAQWGIDGADPISFVEYFAHPRPGNTRKNILMQFCNPDDRVPVAGGIRLADAAGLIDETHQENLLTLGVLDWAEGFTTAQMNFPYESAAGSGWRLFPAYNHEFMLAPQDAENSIMFSFISKNQAAIFLDSDGQLIVDDFRALCPDEFYVEGY